MSAGVEGPVGSAERSSDPFGGVVTGSVWEAVAAAGFSREDVEAYARWRARQAHDDLVRRVVELEEARDLLVWADDGVGLAVPGPHRWGRGPRLTRTDVVGSLRVAAAVVAAARARADAAWNEGGDVERAVAVLAQYEARDQHDIAVLSVGMARKEMDRDRL